VAPEELEDVLFFTRSGKALIRGLQKDGMKKSFNWRLCIVLLGVSKDVW
jgi:hypothetical protein